MPAQRARHAGRAGDAPVAGRATAARGRRRGRGAERTRRRPGRPRRLRPVSPGVRGHRGCAAAELGRIGGEAVGHASWHASADQRRPLLPASGRPRAGDRAEGRLFRPEVRRLRRSAGMAVARGRRRPAAGGPAGDRCPLLAPGRADLGHHVPDPGRARPGQHALLVPAGAGGVVRGCLRREADVELRSAGVHSCCL